MRGAARIAALIAAGLPLLPAAAGAQTSLSSTTYHCERGVEIAASFIGAAGSSVAVIQVEGRQITLLQEPAASGARYGWPSDGAGYVFWTRGAEATVSWRDGAGAEPVMLYAACRAG